MSTTTTEDHVKRVALEQAAYALGALRSHHEQRQQAKDKMKEAEDSKAIVLGCLAVMKQLRYGGEAWVQEFLAGTSATAGELAILVRMAGGDCRD